MYKTGDARQIQLCPDAEESLAELLIQATKDLALQRMLAKVERLFERFVSTGVLNNEEHFNSEGDGFYAFKAYQLRAYGWYSSVMKGSFVVSHFVRKKKDKLRPEDKARMKRNKDQHDG